MKTSFLTKCNVLFLSVLMMIILGGGVTGAIAAEYGTSSPPPIAERDVTDVDPYGSSPTHNPNSPPAGALTLTAAPDADRRGGDDEDDGDDGDDGGMTKEERIELLNDRVKENNDQLQGIAELLAEVRKNVRGKEKRIEELKPFLAKWKASVPGAERAVTDARDRRTDVLMTLDNLKRILGNGIDPNTGNRLKPSQRRYLQNQIKLGTQALVAAAEAVKKAEQKLERLKKDIADKEDAIASMEAEIANLLEEERIILERRKELVEENKRLKAEIDELSG